MLINLKNISKSFLDKTILSDISLSINDKDRIGLLGVNGAGKSTLLNIIAGILEYDFGEISYKKNLTIGYLKQNDKLNEDLSLREEINDSLKEIYQIREEIKELSEEIAKDSSNKILLDKYDELMDIYLSYDGDNAELRIKTVLQGMGFADFDLSSNVKNLSGGEKTRFAISKILVKNPELLLLDEPTNHLDFEMLTWLEKYLSTYKGAVLVVSHDRYFLDNVSTDICEIENCKLRKYKGGYSSFIIQKEELVKSQIKEYEKQQKELNKLKEYVDKNLARSSSANSVGSRVKALEKAEIRALPKITQTELKISFNYEIEPYSTVLECKDLSLFVGTGDKRKRLLSNLNLTVERGQKIAIIGKNGIGKSSLLKAILNKLPYEGKIKFGGNVKTSYFEQEMASYDMNMTAFVTVHRKFPLKTDFEIRSMLARFLITGDDVFKRLSELSGANKAKVALAIIAFENSNLLILDEPTNHLDYSAKESLEKSLSEYTGTIILVSHDRYLLSKLPDKIIELTENGINEYIGNYDYYINHKVESQPLQKEKGKNPDNSYAINKKNKAEQRKARAYLMNLERNIENTEEEIKILEAEINKPEISSDYVKLNELISEIKLKKDKLNSMENEWLKISE